MSLTIGKHTLTSPYLLAPLAGFTDISYRDMCRRYGAGLTYTEMVSAKGLVYGNDKTEDLLRLSPLETPSAVQIFGSEPDIMAEAVRRIECDIIDINMGCPVRKIVSNGEGSALMLNPTLASKVISSCVKASNGRPITVKFRAGFSDDNKNAVEFAKMAQDSGASAITVHGRTREQFYSGLADRELIIKVADKVTIPVIANGDITSIADIDYYRGSKVQGFMIGRGAIGRPEIFSELQGKSVQVDKIEQIKLHINGLIPYLPERVIVNDMKKQVAYYLKGIPGIKEIKNTVFNAKQIDDLINLLNQIR